MIKRIKIVINRTSYWIYGFEFGTKFNKCTSYPLFKAIANVYDVRNKKYRCTLDLYDKNKKLLKLPKGFGLNTIKDLLYMSGEDIDIEIEDKSDQFVEYKPINKIQMRSGYKPRDDIQYKAIQFLSNCYEFEKDPNKGHQLYLTLDVGMGKTFVTIYTIVQLKLPSIIISFNLTEQWVEKIKEYTNAKDNDIYIIRGMESINELLRTNKRYPFYVASVSTMKRFLNYYSDLDLIFSTMGVAIKVFDEAHTQYKGNAAIDVNSNTRFTFYLSATPGRSDYNDNRVYQNMFKNIPIHGHYTHLLNDHYVIRIVKYNTKPKATDIRSCSTHKGFNSIKYYQYIQRSEEKVLLLIAMIKYYADSILYKYPKAQILVYIPSLDFMNYIYNYLIKNYRIPYSIGQYNSNIKKLSDREDNLNKNLILTTLAAGSTGKDLPNLKAILSLTPFSSTVICRQVLGRLRKIRDTENLGEDVYFYDFVDTGFVAQLRQLQIRNTVYKERSKSIETKVINENNTILYLSNNRK